jgi:hypothetical protein
MTAFRVAMVSMVVLAVVSHAEAQCAWVVVGAYGDGQLRH